MRLRAKVRSVAAQIASVDIERDDGGYYLLCVHPNGRCLTDTWHDSFESEKGQAHYELGIEETDWESVGG